MSPRVSTATLAALALAATTLALSWVAPAEASRIRRLEFLGHATVPHGLGVGETPVGGLSALTWDAEREVFYVLSDDLGQRAASRFYTVRLDLAAGRLAADGVTVEGVTRLRDGGGRLLPPDTVDPEGIALAAGPDGRTLFLSSEGKVDAGVAPRLAEVDLEGRWRRDLPLPERYLPRRPKRRWLRLAGAGGGASGVRHNLALESLTLTPDGAWLFTANENALWQDGPAATLDGGSPVRLSRLAAADGRWAAEYLYLTEPVAEAPVPANDFATAGLVELLALDDQHLLALERSYSAGAGNTIRLFEVDLTGASDVAGVRSLERRPDLRPVAKRLLLDLAELAIPLDNLEGLSFGPRLADGRRTLVLVSDDNFSPRQTTQFLAFAFDQAPLSIARVQGDDHRSPLVGQWVYGLRGVVTAVAPRGDGGRVWIEDPAATADQARGLRVSCVRLPELAVGDRVEVDGRVAERERPGELPVTTLEGGRFAVESASGPLPAAVRLGPGGRAIPASHADDDGLQRFEPAVDTLDFFERLEGSRVEIADALVVGPGNRFGECVVVAGGGEGSGPRTRRGGLRLAPFDLNPERIIVATTLLDEPCRAEVGDRFTAPIVGVLDYGFGAYRLLATQPLPTLASPAPAPGDDPPPPGAGADSFTVATFNVENLHPQDEMIPRLAWVIRRELGAPHVVALQEVQDDSGPEDDATTSADATFGALIDAIAAVDGPRYEFHQIDPADGADGGRPGANIRVGFLVDPQRVKVTPRGRPAADTAVEVRGDERGPLLFPNPGRVAPGDPAFAEDAAAGYGATRKPLALEIEVDGRRVFLINAHLKSKNGDDQVQGSRQPPRWVTEEQRSLQAARVRELADRILAADPRAAVVVLGDLNEHEFRGPLTVLTADGLTNLIERVPEPDRYTYNYRGNSQVLDHILVSPALAADAAVRILHLHADFPVPRPSDHDPVLARLRLPAPDPTQSD